MTEIVPIETVPLWDFEPVEPEVGFLSDAITHLCQANEEEVEPAVISDVSRSKVKVNGQEVVAETTTWLCPACQATTANTEHWPLWFYQGEFL